MVPVHSVFSLADSSSITDASSLLDGAPIGAQLYQMTTQFTSRDDGTPRLVLFAADTRVSGRCCPSGLIECPL